MGKNGILKGQIYPFDGAESTYFEARRKYPVANNGKRRGSRRILKTFIVVLILSIIAGVTFWLVTITRGDSKDKIVEPANKIVEPANKIVEPANKIVEPANKIVEPVKKIVEPVNNIVEPVNNIVEPVNNIVEPVNNIVEPVNNIVEPVKKTVEPVKNNVEPVKDNVEPVNNIVEPVNNIVDPVKKTVDPVKKTVDPVKKTVEPVKKTVDPVKKILEPLKKILGPVKKIVESVKKNTVVVPAKDKDTMPADEPAVCENNADKKCTNADIDSLTTKYTEDMLQISKERNIEVFHGDYNACNNACIGTDCVREGKCVYDWELKAVANVIARAKLKITPEFELDLLLKYKKYLIHYGKGYSDYLHFQRRYYQYRKSTIDIENHNKDPKSTYKQGYTSFADLTPEEVGLVSTDVDIFDTPTNFEPYGERSQVAGSGQTPKKNLKATELQFFDWRDSKVVTPVINQRRCGSCWAVSSTGILSSFMAIKTGVLKPYSIQQVLDCTGPPYDCSHGGDHYKALLYISKNPMCTEDEYPYLAKNDTCLASKCKHKIPIKEVVSLKDADARKHLREHGPFLTSFKLGRGFLLYESGIYNGECDSKMVHSVYVVGYGHDHKFNIDYWIVKNSWGPHWGEDGYIRMVDLDEGIGKHCNFLRRAFGIVGEDI